MHPLHATLELCIALQVMKAALLTDMRESGDIDAAAEDVESLLSETMDAEAWREVAQVFAQEVRRVVHATGDLEVVDSCIQGRWQRWASLALLLAALVLRNCPSLHCSVPSTEPQQDEHHGAAIVGCCCWLLFLNIACAGRLGTQSLS
jgi:hypothetical protein